MMNLKLLIVCLICLVWQQASFAQTDSLKFPDLNYPDYNGYKGKRNCDLPMSEAIFIPLARQVFNTPDEAQKMLIALEVLKDNCLAVAQIMKLGSLLKDENNRLNFLKQAAPHVYDLLHYGQATQILQTSEATNAFLQFARKQRQSGGNNNHSNNNSNNNNNGNNNNSNPTNITHTPCLSAISEAEYKAMRRKVRRIYTNDMKEATAKRVIQQYRCLSVKQIRGVLRLFHYENASLRIAKFAYDYAVDKKNYMSLKRFFKFPSNRNSFTYFVNSRK
ncbi:DUF4476 domain-containing protein [uncultured Microscilla sp.]|uniref:DUF4476 domain-containing protein n=1 Tax=uncultured Microscilla sp. TaxID=432653 RepID=UPI002627E7C2|nr:DUF4476 domain-containing protein [uncultured Microscilla sp.]